MALTTTTTTTTTMKLLLWVGIWPESYLYDHHSPPTYLLAPDLERLAGYLPLSLVYPPKYTRTSGPPFSLPPPPWLLSSCRRTLSKTDKSAQTLWLSVRRVPVVTYPSHISVWLPLLFRSFRRPDNLHYPIQAKSSTEPQWPTTTTLPHTTSCLMTQTPHSLPATA